MRPASENSSLRSLARTSAVSTPSASSTASVSENRAPRGTASRRPFSPIALPPDQGPEGRLRAAPPPAGALADPRDVQALDIQRPAHRREVAPEAPEQLVVAPAAAEGSAERG